MPTIDEILRARRRESTFDRVAGGSSSTAPPPPSIFDRLSQATQEPLPMEGRLSFLPAMVTPERGREWALPGVLAGAWNAFTAPGRALQGQELGPDEALNVAGTAMLGGMPVPKPTGQGIIGLNVFHGSPHRFDKFDMSKIGTGEGAQAYGHGLYLAENPSVAKGYVTAGKPSLEITYKGNEIPRDHMLARAISAHDGDLAATEKWLRSQPSDPQIKNALDVIQSKGNLSVNKVEGNLYKVDLPDEQIAKMLDWDKPLSQQPHVMKALERLGVKVAPETTGQQLMQSNYMRGLSDSNGIVLRAEDALRQKGIPGIKYLDQGSRGATGTGKWKITYKDGTSQVYNFKANDDVLKQMGATAEPIGTSNFVVFDDKLPKILSRE